MATKKTNKTTKKVTIERPGKTAVVKESSTSTFLNKIQNDLQSNQSWLNLVLGALVVLVLGVLMFNYFSKPTDDLGPSQQTDTNQSQQVADVAKDSLPGKYTVKEGDTLFLIAQSYYNDGYKFDQIAKANDMANPNAIEVGQVLNIPKVDDNTAQASPTATPTAEPAMAQSTPTPAPAQTNLGTGGAINQTIWGETITGSTYTVQQGDWLSKIAGRAYGDVLAYQKLAQANNITNPDVIEPGTVLKIPR